MLAFGTARAVARPPRQMALAKNATDPAEALLALRVIVRAVGIEPTLLAEPDFEPAFELLLKLALWL